LIDIVADLLGNATIASPELKSLRPILSSCYFASQNLEKPSQFAASTDSLISVSRLVVACQILSDLRRKQLLVVLANKQSFELQI
jgi:hypothetical protein